MGNKGMREPFPAAQVVQPHWQQVVCRKGTCASVRTAGRNTATHEWLLPAVLVKPSRERWPYVYDKL